MICRSVRLLFNKSSINCFVKTLVWRNMADRRPVSNVAIGGRSSTDSRNRRSTNTMSNRLVWVDLEMTGLDVDTCQIIEMACLITDDALNIVAEGPNLIIHQSDEVLANMNDWCKEHHGKSGLTEEVRKSTVTLENAEYQMLGFIRQHTPPGKCPLAGNTVHMDKMFLEKYMKQFMYHLHYRIVDVSTVKELCRRWYPNVFCSAPTKMAAHRALDDIKESIKELKYYRENIFLSQV